MVKVLLVAPGTEAADANRVAQLAWALSVLGHSATGLYTARRDPAAVIEEALVGEVNLVVVLEGADLPPATQRALARAGVPVAHWPSDGEAEDVVERARDLIARIDAGAVGASVAGKPEDYYEHVHGTLLSLIPAGVRRVLDVGCAAGRLGAALKARGSTEVIGIEVVPEVAERARARLDQVFVGDAEKLDLPFPAGYFDCIVYGDVLEHLRDPWEVLKRHLRYLSADGSVVASIPNVNHFSVVAALLGGAWPYQPAGILDRTHLRFFTLSEIVSMFESAGLMIVQLAANTTPDLTSLVERFCEALAPLGMVSPTYATEAIVVQYVFRAIRKPA